MADTPKKAKGGRKNRKYHRNLATCLTYKNSHRREHNKIRKLKKHIAKYPTDKSALAAVENCLKVIRGY